MAAKREKKRQKKRISLFLSQHKFDLGRTETLLNDILLKSEEPVYVKQFRKPDAHREEVEKHVNEWLKMGVVQPWLSKFNSPIFDAAKNSVVLG